MSKQIRPLLNLTAIEVPPKFLQTLEESAKTVKKLKETESDIVSSAANRSGTEDDRRMLQAGLIYLALTEPDPRRSYIQDIVLISRDNLNYALSELTRLVAETWPKMHQEVRKNMLSIIAELLATRGANVDLLMLHSYRRMQGGDLSSQNLWLIQSLLDIIVRNKESLEQNDRSTFLLSLTVYSFLRVIPDHHSDTNSFLKTPDGTALLSKLSVLYQRESNLVIELMRKNFDKCASIGRDFIRLLSYLSRVEPFQKLWNDIFTDITSLSSLHKHVNSILDILTPGQYTLTLINQEMDVCIRWMLRNVHYAANFPVRRYQDLFNTKYLSAPEGQNLRVALTRFIVNNFYPDNEMLASTLMPRWNAISWIISLCTCPIAHQNCKMALFFDWFCFRHNECIMNIEPAMLIITNNLSSTRFQPFALSMLEFFVKTATSFHPLLTERFALSIRAGIDDSLRLGVIRSINPILDTLLRIAPDIYRSFTTLIGPLVDSTLPLSSAPGTSGVGSSTAAPGEANALELGGGGSGGGGGGSFDGNKFHRPHSTVGLSKSHSSDLLSRPRDAIGHTSAINTSATGSPTDPRLRRGSLPNVAPPKNGAVPLPFKTQQRPPSPEALGRFSPPPLPLIDLSTSEFTSPDEVKKGSANQQQSERKTRPQSPPPPVVVYPALPPPQELSALPSNFETLASPECRIGANSSVDTIQQRIDDLRRRFQSYQLRYTYRIKTDVNVFDILGQFVGEIHEYLEKLIFKARAVGLLREVSGSNEESRSSTPASLSDDAGLADVCEAMQNLIDSVLEDDFSDDLAMVGRIADVISQICLPLFDSVAECGDAAALENNRVGSVLLPSHMPITQEQIDGSLASPVFVPLRNLCEMSRSNAKREILLLLLTEIQIRQPRIGYHLLYYLTVSTVNEDRMASYRSFCASQENSSLLVCLYRDLQLLADDNRFLFCFLLPTIYNVFATDLANNPDFLRLVVSKIDSSQVNYLISEILRGHLNLFHRSDITDVLKASLEWSSTEQSFFWQLVGAHELPTKHFLPLISLVDGQKHSEACSQLLLLLQLEKPTNEIVRLLLTRAASSLNSTVAASNTADDLLSVTTLHYWGRPGGAYAQRFAEILGSMVTTAVNTLRCSHDAEEGGIGVASRKRNGPKAGGGSSDQMPLLISILTHLDCMRRNCKNISMLQAAELQTSLQQVILSTGVPAHVKDRFAELLSLVEHDAMETVQTTSTTTRAGGTSRNSKQEAKEVLGTGSSKGGHSLRNLDSRRAAEVERRRSAALESGKRKLTRKKWDGEEGEGDDSSDYSNNNNSTNNTSSNNNANSEEDNDSDGALAIDDSIDASANTENDEQDAVAPLSSSSSPNSPDGDNNNSSNSSGSDSGDDDDDEEEGPVIRGGKRSAKGRSVPTKRQQPPAKKRATARTRKAAPIAVDSDEEGGEESDSEDAPRVTGPLKRRKVVSRRLLDD